MKIAVYSRREDEDLDFTRLSEQYGLELVSTSETLTEANVHLSQGCDGVTFLGMDQINASILEKLNAYGIKYCSTRSIGYNNIDLECAKKLGISICNASYPPGGVAEYTVMLMLMVVRNYKPAMWRTHVNDYSLHGLIGREIGTMTVGIIGTGRIGSKVIELLSGFGCQILACDKYPNKELGAHVRYVSLEELYAQSDMISIHTVLNDETISMIDSNALSKMKQGVILINCSRGELMNMNDMIEGIESEHIGGLGLDVFENESGIYHVDHRTEILSNKNMAYLRQFPHVVMSQHIAFYTRTNVSSMVTSGIEGILQMSQGNRYAYQLC